MNSTVEGLLRFKWCTTLLLDGDLDPFIEASLKLGV
jgi:hypothetical protein